MSLVLLFNQPVSGATYTLVVDASEYTLTGRDLTATPVTPDYTLTVTQTEYTLTGRDLTVTDGGPYVPPADNSAVPGENRRGRWGVPLTYDDWKKLAQKYEKEAEELEPSVKIASKEIDLEELLPRLESQSTSLRELLRDAELLRMQEAQALANAMMVRDAIAMATIAYNLELAVQQEKDAIAGFLMFMD